MAEKTEFDPKAAHKYFSVNCFNQAWDLIYKTFDAIIENIENYSS